MRSVFNIVPSWEAALYNQGGTPVALFDAFESMTLNKKLNDISTWALTFKDNGDVRLSAKGYWELDGQITFRRDLPFFVDDGGRGYFPDTEMFGLVRKITRGINKTGEKIITFEGFSNEHLLARRVIAALQGIVRADKDAPADWAMCEYVYENCGEGATVAAGRRFLVDTTDDTSWVDAPGVMEGFAVQFPRPPGEAPTWTGSKSFENLLEAVQDIGKSKRVDFRVEGINAPGTRFLFRTFPEFSIGYNRTLLGLDPTTGKNMFGNAPVVFSLATENIEDTEAVWDHMDEATWAFMLGSGDMSTRNVLPAKNVMDAMLSPWNQIEIVRSASVDPDLVTDVRGETFQLRDAGDEALTEVAYKENISFTPHQIPKALYGFHYGLGDFVSVEFDAFRSDQRIVGVNIQYDASGEKIGLELESPVKHVTGQHPEQPAGFSVNIPLITFVSASVSPSASLSPSMSASPSVSRSVSRSVSPSVSPSSAVGPPSASPSLSPSHSASPSASKSLSPSASVSRSLSPSLSASASISPSRSVSPSVSRSISPSRSVSRSLSPSASLSPSRSVSPSVSPSVPPEIEFQAFSGSVGTSTFLWQHHPGTSDAPKGALVFVMQGIDSSDRITSVTYGGVALTRVAYNPKNTGEKGAVYAYFSGGVLPSGLQNIVVTISGGVVAQFHARATTFICDALTAVEDYDTSINSDSIANPTCTLSSGGRFIACEIGFVSGQTIGSVSPRAGWEDMGEHDWTTYTTGAYYYKTIDDVNVTAGLTQASDDCIAIAVAVREVFI